ncbi:MAG: hypothetical protein MZW92_26110 [Comamonadaceae bacterium]|nr:hypothetical protein [Comamonadaceae bacterium]
MGYCCHHRRPDRHRDHHLQPGRHLDLRERDGGFTRRVRAAARLRAAAGDRASHWARLRAEFVACRDALGAGDVPDVAKVLMHWQRPPTTNWARCCRRSSPG